MVPVAEMQQLDLNGGSMPVGVRIRESLTLASVGATASLRAVRVPSRARFPPTV